MSTLYERKRDLQILLLQEIGLEIDSTNLRIRDQDTGTYLRMNNKFIKSQVIDNDRDIELDPYNEKIVNNLFAYYCKKMEHDYDNPFIVNHFGDFSENRLIYLGLSVDYLDTNTSVKFETNRYNWINRSLRYIEAICKLNKSQVNLDYYKIEEEV